MKTIEAHPRSKSTTLAASSSRCCWSDRRLSQRRAAKGRSRTGLRTLALTVTEPIPTVLVAVNFQNVPLPEVAAVLDRLSAAGWEWEDNRKNWTAAFRKGFEGAKGTRGADRAIDEIRELMGDYFTEGRGAG